MSTPSLVLGPGGRSHDSSTAGEEHGPGQRKEAEGTGAWGRRGSARALRRASAGFLSIACFGLWLFHRLELVFMLASYYLPLSLSLINLVGHQAALKQSRAQIGSCHDVDVADDLLGGQISSKSGSQLLILEPNLAGKCSHHLHCP